MLCLLVFTDGFKDWSFSHKPWEGGPDKDKVRVEWIGFEENEIIFGETEQ